MKLIRNVIISIEKLCEGNECFSDQVVKALREYAFRVKETGGMPIEEFKTKTGCTVKMFHTVSHEEDKKKEKDE